MKCPDCKAFVMPGRATSIHRAKSHDDHSKRWRVKVGGQWRYGVPA